MARGSTLCNCHSSRIPKPPYASSQPANQRVERGEWGGALSEKAAQLNWGERNLNPKQCWTRAEWVKKHTRLQTHTPRTHTNPHRVSGCVREKKSPLLWHRVRSSWSGAARDPEVRTVRQCEERKHAQWILSFSFLFFFVWKLKSGGISVALSSWLLLGTLSPPSHWWDALLCWDYRSSEPLWAFLTTAVTPAAPPPAATPLRSPPSSSGRSYERSVQSVLHGDAAATRKHHRLQHRLSDRGASSAQPGTLRLHRVPDVHAIPVGGAPAAPTATPGPPTGAPHRTSPAPPDPEPAERLLLQPDAGPDAGHGAHLHPHGLAPRRLLPVPAAPGGS